MQNFGLFRVWFRQVSLYLSLHSNTLARFCLLETLNITIRFPETAVPAQETSYMCIVFDLPSDTDYHLMAYEPVIDNEHVMHHILLYGCDPKCMYTQLTLLFKTLIHLYKIY